MGLREENAIGNKKGPYGPDGIRHPPPVTRISYNISPSAYHVKLIWAVGLEKYTSFPCGIELHEGKEEKADDGLAGGKVRRSDRR